MYHFLVLLLTTLPYLAASQTVQPYPGQDCSSSTFYNGFSVCPNSPSVCCAGAGVSACCAGGCCPDTAICIYVGTANEACCPISNPTECGANPAFQSATNTGPAGAGPSVSCVGVDSDWYCPPGSTCLYESGGCLPPPGSGYVSSSIVDYTPSATTQFSESTTEFPESSTDGAAAATSTGVFGSASESSQLASATTAGSQASTTGSGAAASPTKAAGGVMVAAKVCWTLGVVVLVVVGWVVVL